MAFPQNLACVVLDSASCLQWTFSFRSSYFVASLDSASVIIRSSTASLRSSAKYFEVLLDNSILEFPLSEREKFNAFLAEAQTAKEAA